MPGFRRYAGFALGWVAAALAALSVSACTPFVSVTRVSPQTVGRALAASTLSGDRPSTPTRNVLLEHGLFEAFDADPSSPGRGFLARRSGSPVTLLLRVPVARRILVQGTVLSGTLDLYLVAEPEAITIGGERVPLEVEPTAALALARLSPMILIGQGGLLVKMMVVESGDAIWNVVSHVPSTISGSRRRRARRSE